MSDSNIPSKEIVSRSSEKIKKLTFSAVCIALCYVLPFVTANNPSLGNMLCLMHIPVMLCGFLCGASYGLSVGFIAPLLRTLTIAMPPLMTAIPMAFELATYGAVTGMIYKIASKRSQKSLTNIYISLVSAMIFGRVAGGAVKWALLGFNYINSFSAKAFLSAYILTAWPGIIIQIVFVPIIVMALKKNGVLRGTF